MTIAAADALLGVFGYHRVNPQPRPKKAKAKAKKSSIPALIRKADEITSRYIRTKCADENGNVTCITCGKVLRWQDAHCAHFIGRAKKATRWIEENLHPADASCNVFRKEMHMREYTLYMIDMYGREKIVELKEMASKPISPSQVRKLAEEAIEYYSEALNSLKK